MSSKKEHLQTIGSVEIFRTRGKPVDRTFFYKSGMALDADGAPNAYGPGDTGLDFTRFAGHARNWTSIVTDNGKPSGKPVTQGPMDPFPGLFISTTALEDSTKNTTDPDRYVDSNSVPYISVTKAAFDWASRARGLRMGDLAYVFFRGESSFAILADVGGDTLGEGSLFLADALGWSNNPRTDTLPPDVVYVLFPASGRGTPLDINDIDRLGKTAFERWGGDALFKECFPQFFWGDFGPLTTRGGSMNA